LLDCAHLTIYQKTMGYAPLDGLDGFPCERIVEVHVAGTTIHQNPGSDDFIWYEDDHTPNVLPETIDTFKAVVKRARHMKAVVFECEHNTIDNCLPGFDRIASIWPGHSGGSPP